MDQEYWQTIFNMGIKWQTKRIHWCDSNWDWAYYFPSFSLAIMAVSSSFDLHHCHYLHHTLLHLKSIQNAPSAKKANKEKYVFEKTTTSHTLYIANQCLGWWNHRRYACWKLCHCHCQINKKILVRRSKHSLSNRQSKLE